DAMVRCAAAGALGDIGPRATTAMPLLLRMLQDENPSVRAAAASAIGLVAPGSASRQAVLALAATLEEEKEDHVRCVIVQSLRCFGPHAWAAMPALRRTLSIPSECSGTPCPQTEAIALLARFDPPPVETLAEVLGSHGSQYSARQEAARQLGALGRRSRLARHPLRPGVQEPQEQGEYWQPLQFAVIRALLDIDPDGGPALAAPVLLPMVKESSADHHDVIRLLGRCGAAARPSIPSVLATLDPKDFLTPWAIQSLTPLLTQSDRNLLPSLRQLLSGGHDDDPLVLSEVLLRLGRSEEALEV